MRSLTIYTLTCIVSLSTARSSQADESIRRHAGIEIGSKGVRVLVIEMTDGKAEPRYRRLLAKTDNSSLFPLLDGAITPVALKETVDAVARFHRLLQTQYHFTSAQVHLVASSAVGKAKNAADLQDRLRPLGCKELVFIEPATEARLSIAALVPRQDQSRAILLEIGSGNTNGGMATFTNGSASAIASFHLPFGTVSYAAHLHNRAQPEDLVEPIKRQLEKIPGWNERTIIHLNGGIVWALATLTHPEATADNRVRLSVSDIERALKLIHDSGDRFPDIAPPQSASPEAAAAYRKELAQVRDTFTLRQLHAGLEILKAHAIALDFANRELVFSRQGYVSWLAAYIAGDDVAAPPTAIGELTPRISIEPVRCRLFQGRGLLFRRR